MATEFGFIGHYYDPKENHDKVWGFFYRPSPEYITQKAKWGWATVGRNVCVFWGRRGKAMQFKADVSGYELDKLAKSKINKGYTKITDAKLYEIWSSFEMEKDMKLTVEVLAGRVK